MFPRYPRRFVNNVIRLYEKFMLDNYPDSPRHDSPEDQAEELKLYILRYAQSDRKGSLNEFQLNWKEFLTECYRSRHKNSIF